MAKKARDDFLASRRDEVQGDLAARLSVYLKAAYDLNLEGRSRRLDERAAVDKLNSRRLRGLIMLWKRHLEAKSEAADPVLGVWRAFTALPQKDFAVRAKELHRDLTNPKDPKKAAPVHPVVARVVLATPPTSKGDVVARYVTLFGELETRLKDQKTRIRRRQPPVYPSQNGSRSVKLYSARTVRWRSRWRWRGCSSTRASAGGSIG